MDSVFWTQSGSPCLLTDEVNSFKVFFFLAVFISITLPYAFYIIYFSLLFSLFLNLNDILSLILPFLSSDWEIIPLMFMMLWFMLWFLKCLPSKQSSKWVSNFTTFPNITRTLETLTLIAPSSMSFFSDFYFNFVFMNLTLFIIIFIFYVVNMCLGLPYDCQLFCPLLLSETSLPSGSNFLFSEVNTLIIALARVCGW